MALVPLIRKKGVILARLALSALLTAHRNRRRDSSSYPEGIDPGPIPRRRPRVIYPGDFAGSGTVHYRPVADGQPDPGEVIWTWVPFEEDHALGKDRPVLVVGFDGKWLLALMLSSQDR
ncbi:MAG: hypothetical protein ACRC0L_05490, partial [Angustibacter sp.]